MTATELTGYKFFGVGKDDPVCVNCTHYHLHYVYDDTFRKGFIPTYTGHCCYPRIKTRDVCDTCDHFDKKELKA